MADGGIIDLGYRARPQFVPFHARKQRWGVIVAHRRAGKTVSCVMDLIDAAVGTRKEHARFAYIAPLLVQVKDLAWMYIKRFSSPIPGVQFNEAELRVDFPNGARIRLYGSDGYDRMRGIYLDGAILDEYGDFDPRAFPEVIRPALADRKGFAVFSGTPKSRNDFFRVWERAKDDDDWFKLMLKASETKILDDVELGDARKMLTPEQYEQEFECSFDSSLLGAYYGREIADAERHGRIRSVPYDPAMLVHLNFDLGVDDPTSILAWQMAPDGLRVLRCYENNGHALSHYVAEIQSWGYEIGDCWLPHDAKVQELISGRTRIEAMKALAPKWNFRLVPMHSIIDGINAMRMTFPQMFIDAKLAEDAVEAWRQYHAEYDEKAKVFRTHPKHDWTSHYADCGRYMALAWRQLRPVDTPKPKPVTGPLYAVADSAGVIKSAQTFDQILRQKRLAAKNMG